MDIEVIRSINGGNGRTKHMENVLQRHPGAVSPTVSSPPHGIRRRGAQLDDVDCLTEIREGRQSVTPPVPTSTGRCSLQPSSFLYTVLDSVVNDKYLISRVSGSTILSSTNRLKIRIQRIHSTFCG